MCFNGVFDLDSFGIWAAYQLECLSLIWDQQPSSLENDLEIASFVLFPPVLDNLLWEKLGDWRDL